jgi:hypothetical protein
VTPRRDGKHIDDALADERVLDAVATLREAGFQALRLQDGLPEWRRAGLPVD